MASRALPAPGRPAAGPPAAWRCGLSTDHSWALIFDAQLHNIAEVHRPPVQTGLDDAPPLPFEQAVLLMRFAPQLVALVREVVAAPYGQAAVARSTRNVRHRARALLRAIDAELERAPGPADDKEPADIDPARGAP